MMMYLICIVTDTQYASAGDDEGEGGGTEAGETADVFSVQS